MKMISLIPKPMRRKTALKVLRRRLQKKSYYFDYDPDETLEVYQLGMEIGVPLLNILPNEVTKEDWKIMTDMAKEVRRINEEVASKFNFTAIGYGPEYGENAMPFVYCGFKR